MNAVIKAELKKSILHELGCDADDKLEICFGFELLAGHWW